MQNTIFYPFKNKPDTVQKQYMIEKQCGVCLFGFDSKIMVYIDSFSHT